MSNSAISYLIMFAGIALTGLGIFTFVRQRTQFARFARTDGVVADLIPVRALGEYVVSRTADGPKVQKKYGYRLQIRFTTATGRTIEFVPSISTRPARYRVGEMVEVLYDPRNPQRAHVNSFLYRWFATMMLVGFGLFFIAMGLLGVVMANVFDAGVAAVA